MSKVAMNNDVMQLLGLVADLPELPTTGAYNIRLDSATAVRQSSANIEILPRKDGKSGIDIVVKAGTKNETVYIPAIISHSGIEDLVYNDFIIGDGADVTIIAGCGVHSAGCDASSHEGIHAFAVGRGAKVKYIEKHIGTGFGTGERIINPHTYAVVEEGGYLEMVTTQIEGVDSTKRFSKATLKDGAHLVIKEKIMTHDNQNASTTFEVYLDGEGCGAELSSRAVAKDNSKQMFYSKLMGNNACAAHSECDAIIMDNSIVGALPEVVANHVDAQLIHEAAIGKIAGEQIVKLMTLGLNREEAEGKIIEGFLS